MRGFNYKKAVQSLNYLASKEGGEMNKMKALKLIWLSDRFNLRQFGRTITGDEYYALPNGPIPSATRDILETSNFLDDTASDYSSAYLTATSKYDFKSVHQPNLKVLSQSDKQSLDLIYDNFGNFDHFVLSEISHLFPEWKKHESALVKKLSSRFPINQVDFFLNIEDKSGLFLDSDSDLQITKQLFEDSSKFLSAL